MSGFPTLLVTQEIIGSKVLLAGGTVANTPASPAVDCVLDINNIVYQPVHDLLNDSKLYNSIVYLLNQRYTGYKYGILV